MKQRLLILSLVFMTMAPAAAQTALPVVSPNTRLQMEREVMTRWDSFNPRWYFILFHNKYRTGPDRRNMKQLIPLMAATKVTSLESEQEDKDISDIRDQEMFKMADRSLNKSWYLLYENRIDGLNNRIKVHKAEAVAAGVDFDMLLALNAEQERINADIEITKESYQDDAKKAERFRVALEDLTALRGYYLRLIIIFKTSNKTK